MVEVLRKSLLSRPLLAASLGVCLLVPAYEVPDAAAAPAHVGAASAEPGSRPEPGSARTQQGGSATQGQSDSNPQRPSASPGERLQPPNPAPGQSAAPAQGQPQPMPGGQGSIEGSKQDADSEEIPGGRAGSGGHKLGAGGR